MDIAVVGGGLFGVTTALEISDRIQNANITLYERENDILRAASGINQWRLHRGYHYPRSKPTAVSCRASHDEFKDRYGEAVITEHDHYYCIASENTRTSPEAFLSHCEDVGLWREETDLNIVKDDSIDLCVEVEENHIDPLSLRSLLWKRLNERNIDVRLNHHVDTARRLASEYKYVVVAAYAGNNAVLEGYPDLRREYKFQLIEKPVVTLPDSYHDRSVVVMDGPFMSFDPYGHTTRMYLDHVQHGIRSEEVDMRPRFEGFDPSLLNGKLIQDPPETNFPAFIDSYQEFFNDIEAADHLGSYFTTRTVLPNRNDTDARPTLVGRSENVFRVFSGKMCTCVKAADKVITQINSSKEMRQ